MIGMCATMLFVFVPAISKLNRMLKIGRATVLQFPNEIIASVPAMRALVNLSVKAK